jgi:putative membrane protein
MISRYSDHAANERTFLAWVRTGIAVIMFGLVIERFNIFLVAIGRTVSGESAVSRLDSLALGRYDALALIMGGIGVIVLATIRFARTTRLLDDTEEHSAGSIRTEALLATGLVLFAAGYAIYLAFR